MTNLLFNDKIKLKSEKKSISLVEPFLENIRLKVQIDDTLYYNLLIACTEAVNNSIIHGNKQIETKCVQLEIWVSDLDIIISVKDEGMGFDPQAVEDPRDEKNLLKLGGRGVFIIKELATSIMYQQLPDGMNLIMKFILNK